MATSDEDIGKNVARARGDMSQKDLAAAMRKLGWKWSQATVWSIEKGERPLRLAESEDLKRILRGDRWVDFAQPNHLNVVSYWAGQVGDAARAIKEEIARYEEARLNLALAADAAADDMTGLTDGQATSWIETPPSGVLKEYLDEERANAIGAWSEEPGSKLGEVFDAEWAASDVPRLDGPYSSRLKYDE